MGSGDIWTEMQKIQVLIFWVGCRGLILVRSESDMFYWVLVLLIGGMGAGCNDCI